MPAIIRFITLIGPLLKEGFLRNKSIDAKTRRTIILILTIAGIWLAKYDQETLLKMVNVIIDFVSDESDPSTLITDIVVDATRPTAPDVITKPTQIQCADQYWDPYLNNKIVMLMNDNTMYQEKIITLQQELKELRLEYASCEATIEGINVTIESCPEVTEYNSDLYNHYQELADE